MVVIFYETRDEGQAEVARITYEHRTLSSAGDSNVVALLLPDLQGQTPAKIASTMAKAPVNFDGAYLRVSYHG